MLIWTNKDAKFKNESLKMGLRSIGR